MADESAKQYYVWSPIKYHHPGEDDKAATLTTLKPGSKISKDHPAVADDDTWDAWLEGGVVRSTPWPKGLNPDNPNALSPNAHRLAGLRKQRERLEAELAGVGGEMSPAGNQGEDTTSTAHHPG